MRAALPCLACLLVLSGCLGGDAPPAQADAGPGPDPAMEAGAPDDGAQRRSGSFGWAASVGAPTGQDVQFLSSNGVAFDVDEGRAVLTANVTWDCLAPTCGLHGWLCSPDEMQRSGSPTDVLAPPQCQAHEVGAGPFAFAVDGPAAGEWVVVLMSEAPTAEVSGTVEFYAA